jgi:hypothetical protein
MAVGMVLVPVLVLMWLGLMILPRLGSWFLRWT